ncbi:HEAT repeat domain-containing protein [Couchioplanes caeruleus]|uniref:HEAT repeat domain-containing protein n=1 Tax=Couchioplanes caeruleus TaxID=56438 RepID=UPI0020C01A69|nr:HEAT repeat domain-containing protein [Couchioplanes caeruleus]UQU62903.1 HEAT repeat domain-containing protein [Couchioplanes caeruleus]
MLWLFTVVIAVLAGIVAVTALAIVVVRLSRRRRQRTLARLAAQPRRALLAFVAENGEEGGDELVAVPDDAWRAAEPHALALLGKLRGEAHLGLVSVFLRRGAARTALGQLRSRSRVRRARAAQVLGDLELRRAVPELCRLLTDRHAEVRVVAVRALGRIGDPSAAWRIIAALDRPDPVPSLLATHTLVQLGPEAEVTLSAALDHPQARVRAVCLDALGLLGAAGSVKRIARVLSDDTYLDVRVSAATTLGKLGTRSALEPLSQALRGSRPTPLRAAAARALGDLGAPAAVPALVGALGDDAYQVAHEAAHALRRLGPAGVEALREVVEREQAERSGAHTRFSGAAAHAQEALALAEVLQGERAGAAA